MRKLLTFMTKQSIDIAFQPKWQLRTLSNGEHLIVQTSIILRVIHIDRGYSLTNHSLIRK